MFLRKSNKTRSLSITLIISIISTYGHWDKNTESVGSFIDRKVFTKFDAGKIVLEQEKNQNRNK